MGQPSKFSELEVRRRGVLQDWQQSSVADCCKAGVSRHDTSDVISPSGVLAAAQTRRRRNNGNGLAFSRQ
jgi:hypothetical protein